MPDAHAIAAQVVIATPAVDATEVTARNIERLRPAADLAERVVNAFSALGFKPGPVVGNSFSIEAEPQVFHRVFGVLPKRDADGRMRAAGQRGASAAAPALSALPVDQLPASLRALVQAVVFSEPPAFGPGTMP